ncbi:uncharacterized protein BDW70DRAFT_2174 [Aspergillus foveolatus]|uniref:uncharacterized protein n=1 Tax=Aspergillus foveolatus TaxID=210207 RepID=UPI003CCD5159
MIPEDWLTCKRSHKFQLEMGREDNERQSLALTASAKPSSILARVAADTGLRLSQ